VTGTIPVVFPAYSGDPVAEGYVASLARPGGNVTGFIGNAPELNGKRLELLKAIVPKLSRVAVLWNAASAAAAIDWRETQAAAQVLGVGLLSLPVRGPDDFGRAFKAVMEDPPDALNALPDPIILAHRTPIIDFAARHRLPAMYGQREIAADGGLVMYGANLRDLFRRAATHVDKILKGTKPSDLPVERPTTFDLVINLKTAQALGLTIPQSVLQQATEVIQ
jgi:putative ABC transport system substrate-binding protein